MKLNVGEITCVVPDYFQQIDSAPDDPEGSVTIMTQSEMALCFALLYPLRADEAMPFDEAMVIKDIRQMLDKSQGIVEVRSDENKDRRFIYSIVRSLKEENGAPAGIQYILCLDIETGGKILHLQGYFDEVGVTGVRESMVYIMQGGEGDSALEGWAQDPYDPTYKKGALSNVSENVQFDSMFPAHPLSMAREMARCVTEAGGAKQCR